MFNSFMKTHVEVFGGENLQDFEMHWKNMMDWQTDAKWVDVYKANRA